MSDLHQKKFYSNDEVDRIVNTYATILGAGYSETLRAIVQTWEKNIYKFPVVGTIENGKIEMSAEEILKREG